jgi:hypothetical protein
MMDNETILKLFKKFAGDPLNIYGLLVTPVKVEPSSKTFRGTDLTNIYFKVTNPNNVSYFSPIVEDYIYDETEDFESFVNEKIEVYFVPSFKTGMYINEELRSKIQKVFNSVKVIEFTTGTPFVGYERYKLFIESVGLSIGGWDSESYYIINNAKIKSAYKNGEPCDIKEAKDEYTEVFLPDKDSYWETENLYMEIDNILNEYPLFSDPYRNVVSYYDTKFVE